MRLLLSVEHGNRSSTGRSGVTSPGGKSIVLVAPGVLQARIRMTGTWH